LTAFKKESAESSKPRLLLTAAVAAGVETVDKAYEVSKLAGILDFINLMAYDLHGSWEPTTGHHTALEGPPGDTLTVSYAVQYWLDKVNIFSIAKRMPPNNMVAMESLHSMGSLQCNSVYCFVRDTVDNSWSALSL